MAEFAALVTFIIGVFLSSGNPGTTVILLPDEGGKVGAVTVKTTDDFKVVDQAYNFVTANKKNSRLSGIQMSSEAQVNQEYGEMLKAQPAMPASFILYFVSGSNELTEDSKAVIPQILDRIKGHGPTEISVIGHTDTTGADEFNEKLSLERATAVEKILKDDIPDLEGVSVKYFGSKDPLVPTGPNVDEPRNRRVEVVIL